MTAGESLDADEAELMDPDTWDLEGAVVMRTPRPASCRDGGITSVDTDGR